MHTFSLKTKILFTLVTLSFGSQSSLAALPDTLKLDYAYYAPTSLVVKEQKLLEKALPKTGIKWALAKAVTVHSNT
jgi:sulfonate transport system substrate-binding protein